ncbi:hypothetical protein [Streptomyces sp. NPDC047108]|uniref:hypothetical protein n=1 Tax=Streptomyces sp. NPDC047108 TaxID=3155025 RepID=UPI0033EB43D5
MADVAGESGVLLDDAGVEEPGEWIDVDWNQQIVAHLLLMAAHRAAYCGLSVRDLTDFLSATAPSTASAGTDTDADADTGTDADTAAAGSGPDGAAPQA